ncbi:hypothetical protein GJA_920 [Janthinobacterium agaricidamnosum NBRC 102515 = DSM 9628]|uniref:Uncharacterized protein n=1 Tax=Janthinobacterium agaricidamnosum NBRC 102515 = DSM 9628 TaxID=1349767 RepID=W0V129_9BURK|nr:hypothetical protein GJA_920 [Janthinobacterium agaricidamnosum NBRC 102515 = DSM 9628]
MQAWKIRLGLILAELGGRSICMIFPCKFPANCISVRKYSNS